MKGLKDSWD